MKEYFNIKEQISKLYYLAKERGWDIYSPLIIEPPATKEEIFQIESEIGIKLPNDFKKLLLECSKHIQFRYTHHLKPSNEFKGLFSGYIYWELNNYAIQYRNYKDWVEATLSLEDVDDEEFEEQKHLMNNKVPLMKVPNGDLIVIGYDPSEVLYFSHDWGTLHGKRLGNSLLEFLQYYIKVGFSGPEDWQFEPFLSYEDNKVIYNQEKVAKWQQILGIGD